MNKKRLFKATFVTLMVCATAGTLFACGGNKEYKVVYLGGEGATGEAPVTTSYKEGAKFTVANNTFTKEGYTFDGWTDGTNTVLEGVEYTMGKADVTFTAQWKENTKPVVQKYKVTYSLGTNAAADAKKPDDKTDLEKNAKVTLPEAPKAAEGYEFTGWKIGEGKDAEIKMTGEFTVTADVTVTAQWKPKGTVEEKYTTDAEVKEKILNWWTADSLGYYVADGEEVTIQATISATGAVQAYTGLLTDIALNDDFYRIRPDAAAFTNGGGNTWGGTYPTGLVIDATGWNFDNYAALFADGASVIQVVNISLEDNVVTITVTNYAGADTELATPVTSAKYTITSTKDITEVQPFFYTDGGAAVTTASAKYAKASNTYVKYSFDNAKGDDAEPDVYDVRGGTEFEFGAPTRTGWTFDGWKSSDETDTKLYVAGDKITVAGALTFTAQWTQDEYTVTYALGENHGTDATAPTAIEGKHYGDTITLPAEADTPAAAENYMFAGWKVGDETDLYKAGAEVEIKGSVTITAEYKKLQYTATFNVGDHAADGEKVDSITKDYDDAETDLPAAPAAAENYVFAGWKIGDGADAEIKKEGKITLTESITITAQWDKKQYTATFDVGDHAATGAKVDPIIKDFDDAEIDLPAAPAAEEHYEFAGWKIGEAENAEVKKEGKVTLTASIKITAQWQLVKHTVTFDVGTNAATGAKVDPKKAEWNTPINLPEAPDAEDGYEFAGWKVGTTDTVLTLPGTLLVTGDVTLTAQWASTENSWTVIFKKDATDAENYGKQLVAKDAEGAAKKVVLPTENPSKDGYRFDGWSIHGENGDTDIDTEDLPDVDGNMTIVAKWVEQATATFLKNDGNTEENPYKTTVDKGDELTELPAEPEREGYRFLGWYDSEDNGAEKDYLVAEDLPITLNGNVTYLADWQAIFTVTIYDDLTGVAIEDVKSVYDDMGSEHRETLELPDDLSDPLNLSNFAGWYLVVENEGVKEYGAQVTDETEVTSNMVIAAKWVYTITFKLNAADEGTTFTNVERGTRINEIEGYDAIVTAKAYYRFDGWKGVDATAEDDPVSESYLLTKNDTYTAFYTQVEALPSDNQNPTTEAPITIGTDGTQSNVEWTNYHSNVPNTPLWVGKIARGEKLVMTGIQKSKGENIWDGLIYSIFSGVQLKGQQNVCFNHMNMQGAGAGDLVPTRSLVYDQTGAEINGENGYDDRIKAFNADCNITITWDWSIAKNSIFLTIKYEKDEASAEVVYGYSAVDIADHYSIGLDVDGGYAEITSIAKTTAQASDMSDSILTIGTPGNGCGYTALVPVYSEKLHKGEKVVFTGEMTSPGTGNFQTLGALIYGEECKGYFRMDNWINEQNAIETAENWDIKLSQGPNWDNYLDAIKDCTITLTFDWTNENQIVIFFDLTSHAPNPVRQTMKFAITATEGHELLEEYTIGLGTDHSFTAITSIVRTPAENAD